MARVHKTPWIIGGVLAVAIGVFWLTPCGQSLSAASDFGDWRRQMRLLTGFVAWMLMTLSVIVAVRPAGLDRFMNGLDKAYGLHKWAGISVAVAAICHWVTDKSASWLRHLGLVIPRGGNRSGGGRGRDHTWWYEMAEDAGEWAFYLLLVLVLIALVKYFPYRYFRQIHKLFPVVYLMATYHGILMLPAQWWASAAAYIVVPLTAMGCIAAVISLMQLIGKSRRYTATISSIEHAAAGVTDVHVRLPEGKSMQHKPGQFAFVDFGGFEGAHPFTIASSNTQELRFSIKALGDFTGQLRHILRIGQLVRIEGPYGQFNFESSRARQVWVAGGIGITPFIARLEYLALHGGVQQAIDLWYCTRSVQDGQFPANLDELCAKAQVTLHRVADERQQRLTAQIIQKTVQDLSQTSVWFCGPSGFAKDLLSGLKAMGLSGADFHAERFEMR
ncbi:ferredoxin reductase family protein [Saezia sanguinis]|uniref:ferredoxin reductase family protein n=1 Tax=Saezia sanguinis TaxID=1965230 RepID=UPI003043B177